MPSGSTDWRWKVANACLADHPLRNNQKRGFPNQKAYVP